LIDKKEDEPSKRFAIDRAVQNVVDQVKLLAMHGAQHFFVFNMPDFGILPMVTHNPILDYGQCHLSAENQKYVLSKQLTDLSLRHNALLKERLQHLMKKSPDVQIEVIDIFGFLQQLVDGVGFNQEQDFDYGLAFENMLSRFQLNNETSVLTHHLCYSGSYLTLSSPFHYMCSLKKRTLFYDLVHPSSLAHCWLGHLVQQTMSASSLRSVVPTVDETRSRCALLYTED